MKAVKNGLGVPKPLFVFSVPASDCTVSGQNTVVPVKGLLKEVESQGNMFTVKATTLDMALWKIGGAAVALRLVQLAQVLSFVSMVVGFCLIDGVATLSISLYWFRRAGIEPSTSSNKWRRLDWSENSRLHCKRSGQNHPEDGRMASDDPGL